MISDPDLLKIMAEEQAKLKLGSSTTETPELNGTNQPWPQQKPPKITGSLDKRITELEKQADKAREMASGKDTQMAQAKLRGLDVPTRSELIREAKIAESKAAILRNLQLMENSIMEAERYPEKIINIDELKKAKELLKENKEVIEAITSSELAPFVEVDKKGNILIDVRAAVNTGVSSKLLKQAGVSGAKQEIVRIKLRKAKEQLQRNAKAKELRQKESFLTGEILQHEPLMAEIAERERSVETFERQNMKLGDGRYMSNADFNSLPKYEQNLAKNKGFDALQDHWEKKKAGKFMLPIEAAKIYLESTPEDKFAILKAYGKVPENAQYAGVINGEPTYRIGDGIDSFVMSKQFSDLIVESVVPLVRTIGKWNEMSVGDRALSIAFDALFFLPFLKAGATGAKATTAVTRAGRLAGAVRGVGQELLLQVKAPIDVMLHPIQTVKGTAKGAWNILENFGQFGKIPEGSAYTSLGTIRIPILPGMTEADALLARTKLLSVIEKSPGKNVTLELAGYRFTFTPSALMRETGGLAHTTPQGDAFIDGVRVKIKPGMPMTEQGIFLAPEVHPRFAKTTAFGGTGEMPTIFITSTDEAKNAIGTSKLYKSKGGKVAELEKKYPVDYWVKEPKQILYTRLGPELSKTVIMLQTPLSKAQILKLKALAIVEDFKAPFKPALLIENTNKIKGAAKFTDTIDARELRELTRILEQSGNRGIARNLRAVWNGLNSAREVTRRETQEATRGRESSRIGVGTISVGSRVGATEPERLMFDISAEKIGRVTNIGKVRTPTPVRLVNSARASESGSSRTSKVLTTAITRTPTAEKEDETVPVDGGDSGNYGRIRLPDKDTDEPKRKVYKPKSQKESRKIIREAKIAVGWRQGQLHGKHRYDVIVDPFTPAEEYLIIMGKRPQGVKLVRGPRSAYNSAQTLSGHLGKAGTVDIPGIMHVKMWPEGKKQIGLQFGRDANISNRKRVFPLSRKENEKA